MKLRRLSEKLNSICDSRFDGKEIEREGRKSGRRQGRKKREKSEEGRRWVVGNLGEEIHSNF